jgi:hypothetical protein
MTALLLSVSNIEKMCIKNNNTMGTLKIRFYAKIM